MPENKRPLPVAIDEAIQWMYAELDEQSRQDLKVMDKRQLIRLHRSYGLGIRNTLGLWRPDNPLMAQPELRGMFPDNASIYLIERLWEYLQDETNAS